MPAQQVRPHDHFPSGDSRALATLRFSPEELAECFELAFEEGFDGLDWFALAAIALPDGSQAWLMRHQGNPEPGTVVYVDADADLDQARAQVVQVLVLSPEDFLWVSPFVASPGPLAVADGGMVV